MHILKKVIKVILNNGVLLFFGLLILLGLSLYNYKSSLELKLTNIKIKEKLNKITKLLTPTPTLEPLPTTTPSPTLTSEYIFMTMPNNGVILSCKRSSQQALFQASAAFASAQKDYSDCVTSFRDECDKKCGSNINSTCYKQCSLNKTCSNFEAIKSTYDPFIKLIKENCIGGNNLGFY